MINSKSVKNVLFGFGGQLIIIILGIIIPRIMIMNYGSDINGLLSTVTQIFTYMALMEAGIGQSAKNALYKEIAKKNENGISYIVSVAQRYFRKMTLYYAMGVLILSFVIPIFIKSNLDKMIVFGVIFLEGMSGVISFYYIQTPSIVLSADGRHYINNGVFVINKTIGYIIKIIMAVLGINIIILQFTYFLITIGKVFFYKNYFRKYYNWINYKVAHKTSKLKDKNAFILTEIAWTVFSSTDMIVLSIFVSTQMSSVYSVYNLVFTNLNILLNSVYTSVSYILGQTFHKNKRKYILIHDMFTSIFLGGMVILMCVAYILILPFVKLYTNGVTDTQYIYSSLPLLFCLIQILSWSRFVTGHLTGLAGYARQVSVISSIEAIVNLVFSIVLVQKYSIEGVLLATVLALPIKVIYCVYLCDKKILCRPLWKSVKILGMNYMIFVITILGNKFINLKIYNYIEFFIYALIISFIYGIIGIILNFIANPSLLRLIKNIKKYKKI